jgi:hypothetical protein
MNAHSSKTVVKRTHVDKMFFVWKSPLEVITMFSLYVLHPVVCHLKE